MIKIEVENFEHLRCKVVKFEVLNFEHLRSNTIENYKLIEKKIGTCLHRSCSLHIIGANIKT